MARTVKSAAAEKCVILKNQVSQHTLDEICKSLSALRLTGVKDSLIECYEDEKFSEKSFIDKLYILLSAECEKRAQSGYRRRLKTANLQSQANEAVIAQRLNDYSLSVDRLAYLMEMNWARKGQIVLITGATGLGKSDLGAALCDSACRKLMNTRSFDYSLLIMSLSDFYEKGNAYEYKKILKEYTSKCSLMMLDDVCLGIKRPSEAIVFKDLLDLTKKENIGMVLLSQATLQEWHKFLGGDLTADAVLDRINERAIRIELSGDSKRIFKTDIEEKKDEN